MTELQTPASALAASVAESASAVPAAAPVATIAPAPASAKPTYDFEIMDVELLVPHSANVRTHFAPGPLQALAENIKAVGLAQPILVRPLPAARLQDTWADRPKGAKAPTHEIIAGERRFRAVKLAGLKAVPVLVRPLSDDQALRMQVIENVQRESLHPLEEAEGFYRLLHLESEASKPMAERMESLAGEIKKSTRYIYQTLQLRKLAEFPRQVFLAGLMDRSIALEVATIGNEAQQIEACRHVAGLAKTGMEVTQNPLSHRAAAEYIRNNHRLVLSKAPFPIKVEFAGVGPCTTCEKMSANARDLFEEGAKVPDTCMDRSCYGKKNAAHFEQVAQAAKKSGARVITGKEAKKLLPYDNSPDYLSSSAGYDPVDGKRWEGQCDGKTLRQLLGKDMPQPVLVQRPDGQGFIEVLPSKDAERLLKERGLLKTAPGSSRNAQADAEAKARKIKAYRMALAQQVLEAARTWPNAPAPTASAPKDTTALLSSLLLPLAVQAWHDLGHDSQQRAVKLLGWAESPGFDREKTAKRLQQMDPVEFNAFTLALLMGPHTGCNAYSTGPDTPPALASLATLVGVDAKKLKAEMDAAAKAKAAPKAARAKGGKADKGTKGSKGSANTMLAALYPSPTLAKIVGSEALPRTDIVSKLWDYVKSHKLQDQVNKRMVNADEQLKALFGKAQVSMFEMAGLLSKHAQPKPWGATDAATADATTWRKPGPVEFKTWKVGQRVKVRDDAEANLSKGAKPYAGRVGTLENPAGPEAWWLRLEGSKGKTTLTAASVHYTELLVPDEAEAQAPQPAKAPAAKKAAKPAAPAPAEKQLDLGDLDQGKTTLSPVQAWPFPTAKTAQQGAKP